MRASVLISSYNYEGFITEAVQSALSQTRLPDEIIVVDDGSTDCSVERLRDKFGQNHLVRIIEQRNQGQLAAFNTAYHAATGDLIFFLDPDDIYDPEYLDTVVQFYQDNPSCDFLYCAYRTFGRAEECISAYDESRDFGLTVIRTLYLGSWIGVPTSTLSIRKQILDKFMPVALETSWRTCADACIAIGASLASAHKFFLAVPMVRYRVHDSNTSFGRAWTIQQRLSYKVEVNKLIGHVAGKIGLFEPTLMNLVDMEFTSQFSPRTRDDWRAYRKIILRSRRGLQWKLIKLLRITRYYWMQ